jgi:hypothetical protein
MRTRLSSPLTLLYKIGLPSLFACLGLFLIAASLGDEWNKPGGTSVPMSSSARVLYVMAGLGSLYWVWQCARLKRVEIDDNSLYVSDYRTEIQIPLADIADVRETAPYWFTIIVLFKNDSPFGRSIVFKPRHRFYWSGLHPITRQLGEHLAGLKDGSKTQENRLTLHPAAWETLMREKRSKS